MLYATAVFPRSCGLCNRLFPWARMELFSRLTRCRILAPRWGTWLKIGPYIRGEKDKRHYFGQFANTGYVGGFRRLVVLARGLRWAESEISNDTVGMEAGIVFFSGYDEWFTPLVGCSHFLAERLNAIAHERVKKTLWSFSKEPFIGVHIRRSDFKQAGCVVSDDWYLRAIRVALERAGEKLPIRIFTDARPTELDGFRSVFPGIEIMPQRTALGDLLLLSKASFLVGTSKSTFSLWAAFLGGQPSFWSESQTSFGIDTGLYVE